MKTILFALFLVLTATPAMAQIVERQQGSSSSTEMRSSSSQSGGSQLQSGVGLMFAKMALVELQGAQAFGLSADMPKPNVIDVDSTGALMMNNMSVYCENFKRKSLTYSHLPKNYEMALNNSFGNGENITSVQEVYNQIEAPFNAKYLAVPYVKRSLGAPVISFTRFFCLTVQTSVIEQALTKLRKAGKGYAVPSDSELNKALIYGFDSWHDSPSAKMLKSSFPAQDSMCLIPTPTGYDKGFRTATCGPFEYNMDNRSFLFGGTVMLDQNYVGGRRVVFDETRSSESGRSLSRSTSSGTRRGVKVME